MTKSKVNIAERCNLFATDMLKFQIERPNDKLSVKNDKTLIFYFFLFLERFKIASGLNEKKTKQNKKQNNLKRRNKCRSSVLKDIQITLE